MKEEDLKLLISDIETLRRYILFSFWDQKMDTWYEFHINRYENDLEKFVKFCEGVSKNWDYTIYFNGLNFDMQVIEFVLKNYRNWYNKGWEEICEIIYQFAQHVIQLTNSGQFPPFRQNSFSFKIIDVFEIPHFSNENKRTSLKWLEFMMNMDSIEEMPISHKETLFTKEDLLSIASYCRHDIISTKLWYDYLTGKVEHPFYKGKNKIQDRLDIIDEGLLDWEAINYSDSKLGDELNKRTYCSLTGKTIKDLYELKKSRKGTTPFTFKDAIPDYVKFQTPELKLFHEEISKKKVSLKDKDKQEFPLKFRGTEYTIAKGGIHSTEKNRVIVPLINEYLRDCDVGSQYPNSIKKRKLFPKHLGLAWNEVGTTNIRLKGEYKEKGKKDPDPKWKGLEGLYKLALNSAYFGKTLEMTNWQYGPEVGYYCTIGNQFEILMLIEMLELKGIHCVSANTDGIVCLFDKSLDDTYYEVCHSWEKIVGNSIDGKLEYTDYKSISQEAVNCYVAVSCKGKVKIKGRLDVEGELNKNNTKDIGRVERRAIVNYFSEGTPVEETILNNKDIFDFCIGLKSSNNYFFKTINPSTKEEVEYKKIIRFFISKQGVRLLKIKSEDAETDGPDITRISKSALVTIFNTKFNVSKFEDYNIDYDFYINKAKEIIRIIESSRKSRTFKQPSKQQLKMF